MEFKEDALKAVAKLAMERETGARGLRSIMEEFINGIMYEIPTENNIEKCVITEDVVLHHKQPEYVYNYDRQPIQRIRQRKQRLN